MLAELKRYAFGDYQTKPEITTMVKYSGVSLQLGEFYISELFTSVLVANSGTVTHITIITNYLSYRQVKFFLLAHN